MNVRGPFNIQFLVRGTKIYVIEMNLRSSRSMPYVSKSIGINIIKLAAKIIMGGKIPEDLLKHSIPPYDVIKVPQFSFMRLDGADPILGVEMMSTGEVACIGEDFADALIKSMIAAEFKVPIEPGNILITVAGSELKQAIIPAAKQLQRLGHKIYATAHTADILVKNGVNAKILHKVREPEAKPNIMDYILSRKLSLVINIPQAHNNPIDPLISEDEYKIRRKAVEFNIPVITNMQMLESLVEALEDLYDREIKTLAEYYQNISVKSLHEYHKYVNTYW